MIIANSLSASGSSGGLAYSGTWAGRPAANTLAADAIVFFSDFPFPGVIGSFWKAIPITNAYAPLSGDLLLSVNLGKAPTDGSSDDQKMQSIAIPIGMIPPNFRIEIACAFSKDSGAIAGTYRVRWGENDDDTDPVIHEVAVAASTRSDKIQTDVFVVSNTSVSVTPTPNGNTVESTNVWPADVTIPDLSDTATFISVYFEPAGATIMELVNCRMTLQAL